MPFIYTSHLIIDLMVNLGVRNEAIHMRNEVNRLFKVDPY